MDIFGGIVQGFQVCLTPTNLLYCFIGVFVGTLIGVLPGLGPVGTIAILLPVTFGMEATTAIIMLSGIYYGSQYAGSRTSILLNIPGEASSIVTCFDGYPMAQQGRAGPALGMSAMASFIGGTFSIFALIFLVFPLAKAALAFGPPEYFGLMSVGMVLLTYLGSSSKVKSMIMIFFGLALAIPGTDQLTGQVRFTFGNPAFLDGIGLIPIAMGFFGITEVLENLEDSPFVQKIVQPKFRNLFPNRQDWKKSSGPIARGSLIGFLMGILPGGGSVVSTFLAYIVEKKISKHPEQFGKGAIEGLAAPEAANNAAAGGGFIPLLALGIPPNAVMALLFSAFMIHGLSAGPLMIIQNPDVFWGVIASMYVGNIMLMALNLPLIGVWVKFLKTPNRIMMPIILLFCLIGAYSTNNNVWDIFSMAVMGIIGFILKKNGFELAPATLAFVLGPMLETNFRLSLVMGDLSIFFTRPICASAIGVCLVLFASSLFFAIRDKQKFEKLST
jgi:putative tricarboxylic transport membrane protein